MTVDNWDNNSLRRWTNTYLIHKKLLEINPLFEKNIDSSFLKFARLFIEFRFTA